MRIHTMDKWEGKFVNKRSKYADERLLVKLGRVFSSISRLLVLLHAFVMIQPTLLLSSTPSISNDVGYHCSALPQNIVTDDSLCQ